MIDRAICGILAIMGCIWFIYIERDLQLVSAGPLINAEIVTISPIHHTKGNPSFTVNYHYKVAGQDFSGTSFFHSANTEKDHEFLSTQKTLPVHYKAEDPSDSRALNGKGGNEVLVAWFSFLLTCYAVLKPSFFAIWRA